MFYHHHHLASVAAHHHHQLYQNKNHSVTTPSPPPIAPTTSSVTPLVSIYLTTDTCSSAVQTTASSTLQQTQQTIAKPIARRPANTANSSSTNGNFQNSTLFTLAVTTNSVSNRPTSANDNNGAGACNSPTLTNSAISSSTTAGN